MALKKKMIRKWRKNTLRHATDVKEEILKRDDDGVVWPRKDWGFCVTAIINGYKISSPDSSPYRAWQGMNACVKWAMTQPPFEKSK